MRLVIMVFLVLALSACVPSLRDSPQGSVDASLCDKITSAVEAGTFQKELAQAWYGWCF